MWCLTWVGYVLVGQTIMKKYKPLTIVFYDFLQVFVYVSLFQSPTTTISEVTLSGLMDKLFISVVGVSTWKILMLLVRNQTNRCIKCWYRIRYTNIWSNTWLFFLVNDTIIMADTWTCNDFRWFGFSL